MNSDYTSNRNSRLRLLLSALVAFIFYFSWTYWANNLETVEHSVVLRSALVQACFSASVTLGFSYTLELLVKKYRHSCISLIFIVPILCSVQSKTKQNISTHNSFTSGLNWLNKGLSLSLKLKQPKVAAIFLLPLIPILVQSFLVIVINIINQTPSLWLTVAPSLFFTSLYGYSYTYHISK